jgi:hypothetical protein
MQTAKNFEENECTSDLLDCIDARTLDTNLLGTLNLRQHQ